MDRSRFGLGRVATAIAFGLAALCFLLPFVTAGCDERTTAQGIDFVTGHEPPVYDENGVEVEANDDDSVAVKLIKEGGPAATLALTFVLVGAVFSFLPGATGAAASFVAGAVGLGGFLLFLLGLELRIEGVFADLRIGFWLWAAIALVGLTYFVALSALVLTRSPTLERAGAATAALGLACLVLALESVAFFATFDGIGVGDGLWIQLLGSALVLAGGLLAARNSGKIRRRASSSTTLLAVVGAGVVVAATLISYDRGAGEVGSRALLGFDLDADRWFALVPLVLALGTVLAVLLLGRETASGALLGLGAGLVIAFVPLLYPAIAESDDSIPASAGSFVGFAGAALVAVAGLLATRDRAA